MWFVIKRGVGGAVTSTLVLDWKQALEIRNEFRRAGFESWIEDTAFRTVG